MPHRQPTQLLPISEFGTATQLSLKALRLYDEQRLLRPAVVDAANGYRYYRSDQIPHGRLVRTLRDMDLSLAQITDIVAAEGARAETLLHQFAQDRDRLYARQKRAFQQALALMHRVAPTESSAISERARTNMTAMVRQFLARRVDFVERLRQEIATAQSMLAESGLMAAGEPFCLLIDPMSDDEARADAVIPVAAPGAMPDRITIQQLPAVTCAALSVQFSDAGAVDLTPALDELFDWFDRRGYRAIEPPTVAFVLARTGVRADIGWAYEPAPVRSHSPR